MGELFSFCLCLLLLDFLIVCMMFLFILCLLHVSYVNFGSFVSFVLVDTSLTVLTIGFWPSDEKT